MKKALFNVKHEVISVESINDSSHVGILSQSGKKLQLIKGQKGFQAMVPFESDISKAWSSDTKISYLKTFKPEPEIFVFDTLKELIEWLKS